MAAATTIESFRTHSTPIGALTLLATRAKVNELSMSIWGTVPPEAKPQTGARIAL